ncbi:MAG: NAD(P)/FAD-dependent oxidoreductase [Gemmatimonadales bacterium]|nr:NAD(P)/FAD-dependent oxidoreductase [Gemmatimonadales bacterium]
MIIVIGGGPAGFFAATAAREANPDKPVVILEKQDRVLRKVAISGGGRCNLTHYCENARELATHYPRGGRELIGPFTHWGVADTIDWFAGRGVRLKTEPDGRMFPESNSSATIVDCLGSTARVAGIDVLTRHPVAGIVRRKSGGFLVELADGTSLECDQVLIATGGRTESPVENRSVDGYTLARSLGHDLIQPVPSLFTFKVEDSRWTEMAGLAVENAKIRAVGPDLPAKGFSAEGPLLLTHWGLSGPAVLKLSAIGARRFHEIGYRFELGIDWLPDRKQPAIEADLQDWAHRNGKKSMISGGPENLPRRLWQALLQVAGIPENSKWAELSRKHRNLLGGLLKNTTMPITGKATNKEEFVTCGGVPLSEVDLRTMASRVCPGLFLAGEVLDIDGLTGGFNFQAAWTTGRLAGIAMAGLGIPADDEGDPS